MARQSEDWLEIFPTDESLAHNYTHLTPREFPLVMVALFDSMLVTLLRRRLVDDEKEQKSVFALRGELGTYASRVTFAYLLGIISDEEAQIMRKMGTIRNIFAHNVNASYADDDIAAHTKSIGELLVKRFDGDESIINSEGLGEYLDGLKSALKRVGKCDVAFTVILGTAHAVVNSYYWRNVKHLVRLQHAIDPTEAHAIRAAETAVELAAKEGYSREQLVRNPSIAVRFVKEAYDITQKD